MERFSVFLTTETGDSVGARIVIDLDSLTVTIRDDPVARYDLDEVQAERTGRETLDMRVGGERFRVATPRADQLAKLLAPPDPPEPAQPRARHRRSRVPEPIRRLGRDLRRPPPSYGVWLLAAGVSAAIVFTVWSIVAF